MYTGYVRWFYPDEIFEEIKSTYCYREITEKNGNKIIHFITSGGNALQQYDDYKKVEVIDGLYKITKRRIAMRASHAYRHHCKRSQ